MATTLFFVCIAALLFNFVGYPFVLRLLRSDRLPRVRKSGGFLPMHVVLPVFNEAKLIGEKLKNIYQLDYPADSIKFVVVDGQSTDETMQVIQNFPPPKGRSRCEIRSSDVRGKIPQLNVALREITADSIVVISDADARIVEGDALRVLNDLFQTDASIGVVGGWTTPAQSALEVERAGWWRDNELRFQESETGSASIVVAPFYAFRRSLLTEFPSDCIADDVFVSFLARSKGLRVVYSREIQILEARTAPDVATLLFHKLRKANAYARETVRFRSSIRTFSPISRFVFLTKVFQFWLLPWATILGFQLGLSLFFSGRSILVMGCAIVTLAGAILSTRMFRTARRSSSFSPTVLLQYHLLVFLAVTLNSILFWIWRPSSSYSRISSRESDSSQNRRRAG